MKKFVFLLVICFLLPFSNLDAKDGPSSKKQKISNAKKWWNSPGNVHHKDYQFFVAGAAQIKSANLKQAKQKAREDGRRQIEMALGYGLETVITDKGETHREVSLKKRGGVITVHDYHREKGVMYCLMGFAKKPAAMKTEKKGQRINQKVKGYKITKEEWFTTDKSWPGSPEGYLHIVHRKPLKKNGRILVEYNFYFLWKSQIRVLCQDDKNLTPLRIESRFTAGDKELYKAMLLIEWKKNKGTVKDLQVKHLLRNKNNIKRHFPSTYPLNAQVDLVLLNWISRQPFDSNFSATIHRIRTLSLRRFPKFKARKRKVTYRGRIETKKFRHKKKIEKKLKRYFKGKKKMKAFHLFKIGRDEYALDKNRRLIWTEKFNLVRAREKYIKKRYPYFFDGKLRREIKELLHNLEKGLSSQNKKIFQNQCLPKAYSLGPDHRHNPERVFGKFVKKKRTIHSSYQALWKVDSNLIVVPAFEWSLKKNRPVDNTYVVLAKVNKKWKVLAITEHHRGKVMKDWKKKLENKEK